MDLLAQRLRSLTARRFAAVTALLALVAAVAAPSWAADAASTAKRLIGGKQIKNGSITTKDIRDGSLRAADFKAGALPAGPAGPSGPAGPAGPAGPSGASASSVRTVRLAAAVKSGAANVEVPVPLGGQGTFAWTQKAGESQQLRYAFTFTEKMVAGCINPSPRMWIKASIDGAPATVLRDEDAAAPATTSVPAPNAASDGVGITKTFVAPAADKQHSLRLTVGDNCANDADIVLDKFQLDLVTSR